MRHGHLTILFAAFIYCLFHAHVNKRSTYQVRDLPTQVTDLSLQAASSKLALSKKKKKAISKILKCTAKYHFELYNQVIAYKGKETKNEEGQEGRGGFRGQSYLWQPWAYTTRRGAGSAEWKPVTASLVPQHGC